MTAQDPLTDANGTTAVATLSSPSPAYDGLVMRISPKEAIERFQRLQAFVKECMDGPQTGVETWNDGTEHVKVVRDGLDYGIIPGTKKLTLYKPGAEKLAELYGLGWRTEWREAVKDWDKNFFYFEAECVLFDRATQTPVGNGIGSCNSREDKYAYRWVYEDEAKREGIAVAGLKSKKRGYGKNQTYVYRVPNDDICSTVNTIQKMAAKRAFVGTVIAATRSGGIFTSDFDTMSEATVASLLDEDERAEYKAGTPADQKAMLVEKLLSELAEAKTDLECKAVGYQLVTLKKLGAISGPDEEMLRNKIRGRRAEPEIVATAEKKAPAAPPGEAPKAPTSQPEQKSAAPDATPAPAAPKSEPKAEGKPAEKPKPRAFEACGAENDGCKCTRPKDHDPPHFDERVNAEWGGES
ncbi:MAG TPA: hypothetical protein VGH28_14085 [Polyangiaceae bacterium]